MLIVALEVKLHQLHLAETQPSEIKPPGLIIPRLQPAPSKPLPAAAAGWSRMVSQVTETQCCAKSLSQSSLVEARSCRTHKFPLPALPQGPCVGGSNLGQHGQSCLLLLHFGKELGGFPNASAWQLILNCPSDMLEVDLKKAQGLCPYKLSCWLVLPVQHLPAADNLQSINSQQG